MQPKVLDLFAGCGGLSLGLSQAGCEIVAAVEIDQWAADTYRRNHLGVEVIQADIRSLDSGYLRERFKGGVDLIAGGPPCQGFSVSGKRQYGHIKEQNNLVEEFIRVVEAVEPKVVLIENVSGFRTGHIKPGNPVMSYLKVELNRLGYEFDARVLQATEYGVPSLRRRIFVVGSRIGFPSSPFPIATHSAEATISAEPFISTWDAISDLPSLRASEGVDEFVPYAHEPANDYQREIRAQSSGVANHIAMKHTPRLVERFTALPQGSKGYDLGRTAGRDGEGPVTIYKSNNQRLIACEPSLCITANFQSTYVHPFQPRNLTAREAARLMSYPDTYYFCGKRTQMSSGFLKKYGREHEDFLSQYNQIGNSVPPRLGRAIGLQLRSLLSFPETQDQDRRFTALPLIEESA
ncbi:DNA cytosine methyltransferase [Diaphorobacter sp. MNS-0]|uniref:DNA cytosine methyltransferase n=1 Tax=Diaphorobacter sp. MNS-0 TaxID=2866628 RepID=UPI001C72D706|nr:DNA cytosine methyltransferase [Diaphorobacter sp. MNS-0]QYY25856.1 DNA cytosine methyltransferase [Diaphorobacter sp. MNS-0]